MLRSLLHNVVGDLMRLQVGSKIRFCLYFSCVPFPMNMANVPTSRRALLFFIPISFAACWTYLSSQRTMNSKTVTPIRAIMPHNVRQHPTYWFDDGSIIVRSSSTNNQEVAFKLHESLLRRQSRFVQKMLDHDSVASTTSEVLIPQELGVEVNDLTALLQHLYHDT